MRACVCTSLDKSFGGSTVYLDSSLPSQTTCHNCERNSWFKRPVLGRPIKGNYVSHRTFRNVEKNERIRRPFLPCACRVGGIPGSVFFVCVECTNELRLESAMVVDRDLEGLCTRCYYDRSRSGGARAILSSLEGLNHDPDEYALCGDFISSVDFLVQTEDCFGSFLKHFCCSTKVAKAVFRRDVANVLVSENDLAKTTQLCATKTCASGATITTGCKEYASAPKEFGSTPVIVETKSFQSCPVVVYILGAASAGKSTYAFRLAYRVFQECLKRNPKICKSYSLDPAVVSGDIDYNDPLIVNVNGNSYFPFCKVSDDTHGVLGQKVNEESAVTAFHGRNENTSALKFHQMNYKNFDLKPRLEIETGNVTARNENIMHNFHAFARRYHFVVIVNHEDSLINESTRIKVLHDSEKIRFIMAASNMGDTATVALINSSISKTNEYTQVQFASLVADKVENMYSYAEMNKHYRDKVIEEILES